MGLMSSFAKDHIRLLTMSELADVSVQDRLRRNVMRLAVKWNGLSRPRNPHERPHTSRH